MYQGQTLKLKALEDGLVELVFDLDGESVNKFNVQAVRELGEALDQLEQAEGLTGLLVTSAKPSFMVGADVAEFHRVFAAGREAIIEYLGANNRSFNRLEDLPVPSVVAVEGYALGGGLELCLACDYRILAEATRVGLPETQLGIIPGWGGTVRLPRLAGLDTAVEWIASGRRWDAEQALKAGVADAVVAPQRLRQAALQCLHLCRQGKFDYQGRRTQKMEPLQHNPTEAGMAFETAKAMVGAEAGRHYPAPLTAVKAMEAAAGETRGKALEIEADAFARMASTSVAQALVGIFVGDQALMKQAKRWQAQAEPEVKRAAVLGAGIMGGGIAYQSALKEVPIKLKDIAQKGLDQGLEEANRLLSKRVERGRMDAHAMGQVLNRIEPALSYDGFDRVDMVVEAVVENPKVKAAVLAETENKVPLDTILASNTSTISISRLAEALQRPENFCGMHFFNPVHAMPLVEVIRGERSSDQAIARTVGYALKMGKKPVVVKDCPGFLVNRVLFPYFAGFALLVREGVDFERIDRVMEAWGWPMGPAYLLDVVGLDTAIHAEKVMAEAYPDRLQRDYQSCTQALFQAGRLGQKSGGGFYEHSKDKKGRPKKSASEEARRLAYPPNGESSNGDMTDEAITDEAIVARMMLPMVTELARCLNEQIVASPSEADLAMVYGTGFPAFRGGPLRWVDSLGGQALEEMARPWQQLGALYQLPEGLNLSSAQGSVFYPQAPRQGASL